MTIFLFFAGLVILVLGADKLVDGASDAGRRLGIPSMIIGLTILALGTSLPELIINVFASLGGQTDLAISNVLGSNIVNILLIVGLTAIIRPLNIPGQTTYRDIPASLVATILLGIFVHDSVFSGTSKDYLTRNEGIVFLILIAIYLFISVRTSRSIPHDTEEDSKLKVLPLWKTILYILLGIVGVYFGGEWVVLGASHIAELIGMSESVVGLTIVAIGTSLPELVTSITAIWKKNSDMAVGNAIGSCIFNIYLVLGVSAVITPLPFHQSNVINLTMVLIANLLLFIVIFTGKGRRISRVEGVIMVGLYIAFLIYTLS
ncbi:calcium/sodium antiporter [Bacteroidota bacterium]